MQMQLKHSSLCSSETSAWSSFSVDLSSFSESVLTGASDSCSRRPEEEPGVFFYYCIPSVSRDSYNKVLYECVVDYRLLSTGLASSITFTKLLVSLKTISELVHVCSTIVYKVLQKPRVLERNIILPGVRARILLSFSNHYLLSCLSVCMP